MKRPYPPTPLVWLTVSTGQPAATSNKVTWNTPLPITILEAQVAVR